MWSWETISIKSKPSLSETTSRLESSDVHGKPMDCTSRQIGENQIQDSGDLWGKPMFSVGRRPTDMMMMMIMRDFK